ncbi:MAG TPA: FHA domain-containing protein [Aggregatilineales bacterium]|nr:FHA domain-containing protein [Aggregatilineales bacterium]
MSISTVSALEGDSVLPRKEETVPQLSEEDRDLLNAAVREEEGIFVCPRCGQACLAGELMCPNCSIVFLSEGKTRQFDKESRPTTPAQWPIGRVFVKEQQAITFEIDGQQLILPSLERLVIGRHSNNPEDAHVDVALNAFQASERGVSRRHVRLRRTGDMVYVTDLSSSNGTSLNGRLLTPQTNAVLRDGDELRLGHLTIRVIFTNLPDA